MDKLVILRDCEEEHLVMFCGAQEQPIPKVFSENHKNAEMSRLERTSGDTWSKLLLRTGPWIMLSRGNKISCCWLVNTLLKDNVHLCNALMLNRNNLLYATSLHA